MYPKIADFKLYLGKMQEGFAKQIMNWETEKEIL